jgi:hypothetical protein
MNIGVYATFEEVKEYFINNQGFELTVDDNLIKSFCIQASRRFDSLCNRKFYPTLETKYYDHPPCAWVLELEDDLLEIITLQTQNGLTNILPTSYFLQCGEDYNQTPYDRIVLRSDVGQLFNFSGTTQKANILNGYFGYHEDWANSWVLLDTVQNNPLTVNGTSLLVSDVDGIDEFGLSPRFKTQQLIKFGILPDAEQAYIISKSPEQNTLTLTRGVNGTTAVEQVQTTPIYVYRPMPEIVQAIQILATYSYRRKDGVGTTDDRSIASSSGVLMLSAKIPQDVQDIVDTYKRWGYHSKENKY